MVKPPVLGTGCRGFDSPPSEDSLEFAHAERSGVAFFDAGFDLALIFTHQAFVTSKFPRLLSIERQCI